MIGRSLPMVRSGRRRWRIGFAAVALVFAVAAVATIPVLVGARRPRRPRLDHVETVTVRRADLPVTVSAAGSIRSSNQTNIDCELEALELRVKGNGMTGGGASTILEVVPEGSTVHKDDVLCRLDSTDYEEMARQQRIILERARADHRQAELDLQVAEMALREFRDGLRLQTLTELEGEIALGQSTLGRADDHLAWSRMMLDKGYASRAQVMNEQVARDRVAFGLSQSLIHRDIFQKYNIPRTLRELENQVTACKTMLEYQDARLSRNEGQLENLERQIEHCTIRAPHDGFVIYATNDRREVLIEAGNTVRQRQHLFILPDLGQMEVAALLHESVIDHVAAGMRARVRVEALSGRVLEGQVTAVARLPTVDWFSNVPYYAGVVKLDAVPLGLRPGMSAEVEIAAARRTDALAIPPESLAVENGRDVCYVVEADGLHRREVRLGRSTPEYLEVTEGLDEGEQVVLDPSRIEGEPVVADEALAKADPAEAASGATADDGAAGGEGSGPVVSH
jgi:HlyD family secretion protein